MHLKFFSFKYSYVLQLAIVCTAATCILWYILHRVSSDSKVPVHVTLKPQLLDKCNTYNEFRSFNFLQPVLRHQLCRNVNAYELLADGYPLCVLPNPFNKDIMKIVKDNSETMNYTNTQNAITKLVVFKGNEATSLILKGNGRYWEVGLINWLTRFALKFMPDVTFLDIGCNLGVYTMEAASLGLPVVSMEANIRNILRVRLSLEAAQLNAVLVWNFLSEDRELKYMNFPDSCSTSFSSGKFKMAIKDTVPIMSVNADKLGSIIKTNNIVIKVDIEGGETDFLKTSGRLFTDFNVVAMQMEFNKLFMSPKDAGNMIKIMTDRGYKMWRVPGFIPIMDSNVADWGESNDVLFVQAKFVHLM